MEFNQTDRILSTTYYHLLFNPDAKYLSAGTVRWFAGIITWFMNWRKMHPHNLIRFFQNLTYSCLYLVYQLPAVSESQTSHNYLGWVYGPPDHHCCNHQVIASCHRNTRTSSLQPPTLPPASYSTMQPTSWPSASYPTSSWLAASSLTSISSMWCSWALLSLLQLTTIHYHYHSSTNLTIQSVALYWCFLTTLELKIKKTLSNPNFRLSLIHVSISPREQTSVCFPNQLI